MSKKLIVTTTINKPTDATKKFAKLEGWDFLVVGDTKTPHEEYRSYNYLHPEDQESDLVYWTVQGTLGVTPDWRPKSHSPRGSGA